MINVAATCLVSGFRRCPLRLAAIVLTLSLGAGFARADDSPVQVKGFTVGFQGHFKVGDWTPLRLQVEASEPTKVHVIVEASDADDYVAISDVERSLTAGSQQVQTSFRTARMEAPIVVRLVDSNGKTLFRQSLLPGSGELRKGWKGDHRLRLVVRGKEEAARPIATDDSGTATDSWLSIDAIDLPTESRGYDSVETLLLSTGGRESPLTELTGARNDALRQWVNQGGHLIVTVGSQAERFSTTPIAKWIPLKISGRYELRQIPGLEAYLGKNRAIGLSGMISAARLPDLLGPEVLARESEQPIVARLPFGFGRVTMLAIDLDPQTIKDADVRQDLANRLASSSRPALAVQATQGVGRLASSGVSDLATQLQGAQENFIGSSRIHYWGVMGLILVYIVVLGPLDYLIVHRWLKRPHLTWVTFPLVVVLATLGSIWAAGSQNGNQLQVNQFTLIDIDAVSGSERGWSWCTLLSPMTRRYAVNVKPVPVSSWTSGASGNQKSNSRSESASSAIAPETHLQWVGVPENTVGGLYRSGGLNSTGRSYHVGDGATISDLPVQQWSTKTVVAEWTSQESSLAESKLESTGPGRLRGTVVHKLPVVLDDCLLIHGGRAYFSNRSRRLAPEQEWEPTGRQAQQRDLRSYLTGTEASRQRGRNDEKFDEIVVKSKPYDPSSFDRFDLLRMLSFHQAAGGKAYTGLDHAQLSQLELTDLMDSGRAVLIGRIVTPANANVQPAVVSIDGETSVPGTRETFVRIVLPVKQVPSDTNQELPKIQRN